MVQQADRRHGPTEVRVSQIVRGDLPTLDALEDEAVAVFCWADVRPLAGAAGFLDWRLCGALSRTLEAHFFEGRRSEVMLSPAVSRLRVRRIFAFGLGPSGEATPRNLRHACRHAFDVLTRAGVGRLVFLAPTAPRAPELEQTFLRALDEELPGRVDAVLVAEGP
jgi:hypothetical protein